MVLKYPYSLPYDTHKEDWSDFINRVKIKNKNDIYLFIPKEIFSKENYHNSIVEFIDGYKRGSLIKLN